MTDLSNVVNVAFALEPTKLQRIVGIIESAFESVSLTLSFQIVLANENTLLLSTLSELLAHDNTLANPIRHLVIRAVSDDKYCKIQFSDEKFPSLVSVSVNVGGGDSRWSNHLMAELDEQVERLAMSGPIYKAKRSPFIRNFLPGVFFFGLLVSFFLFFFDNSPSQNLKVHKEKLVTAAQIATESEAKLTALINLSIFIAEHGIWDTEHSDLKLRSLDLSTALVVLPLLLCIGLTYYCIARYYPVSVFAWGDCGERYALLLNQRRAIWTTVSGALLLAVVVNVSSGVLARLMGV